MSSAAICQPQTDAQREVEDEVEVLKSIYPGEVRDLRTKEAWTHWRPPKLALRLRPLHQSRPMAGDSAAQQGVEISLTVRCSARYPREPPELELTDCVGMDEAQVKQLQRKLDDEANSLAGEVMIYQLAQSVESYLYEQSQPPGPSPAEMAAAQLAAQRAADADRERRAIEAEIRKRRSANPIARQRSESEARGGGGGTPVGSPDEARRAASTLTKAATNRRRKSIGGGGAEGSVCPRLSSLLGSCINFPASAGGGGFSGGEFRLLRCLGPAAQLPSNSNTLVCLALGAADSALYTVTEYRRSPSQTVKTETKSLETELLSLTRLSHPNVVRVASVLIAPDQVLLLQEHVLGQSLHVPVSNGVPQQFGQLRIYLSHIVAALEYLHSKDILHRILRPSSLFVTGDGQVKLADYLADWKLKDLFGLPQAARPLVIGRGNKRTDVYALGVLVLELHLGRYLEKGVDVSLPPDLPPLLRNFLDCCLDRLEQQRWTAQQLRQHPLLSTKPLQPVVGDVAAVATLDAAAAVADANAAAAAAAAVAAASAAPPELAASAASAARAATLGGRLRNDFEIVSFLGKGGYGDVVKARNRLDGRLYAVKRVRLKNQRSDVIKKILREVRLLSRLNHEHVVRYYYSWLEDEMVEDSSTTSASNPTVTETSNRLEAVNASDSPSFVSPTKQQRTRMRKQEQQKQNNSGSLEDLVGAMSAQPANSFVFEASGLGSTFGDESSDSGSSEDSSEEEDEQQLSSIGGGFFGHHSANVYGMSVHDDEDEDDEDNEDADDSHRQLQDDGDNGEEGDDCGVVFQRSAGQTAGSSAAVDKADKVSAAGATGEAEASQHRLTSLYIQMEFCERSTLRLAIDNGLPRDERRAWRFFKELLEGLEHIHRCDIIHRDLKPSNVFIDSTDHIKIGDFGLATTTTVDAGSEDAATAAAAAALSADAGGGGSMTGQIGTFFYLAPELLLANKVSAYSAKVDMYSLGVIFFEMTRPDIGTEMERRLLLTDLRLPEVRLPDDYGAAAGADQPGSSGDRLRKVNILRALLCHDPDSRPSARQMLESSQLPAYIFETTQFENLVKSAVAMPESRNYKFLLNCLFSRKVTLPEDHAFDVDMCRPTPVELLSARRWTRDAFERVFARHGAVCQQTPLVMPRLDAFEDLLRPLTVYYLGKDGDVLGLPCDLRVPYARFAARAGVQSARRYAIDRVVRERTMDTHPREMTDCAFDIVCHANAAQDAEAELLHLVHEVVDEFALDNQQPQQLRQQQHRRRQRQQERQQHQPQLQQLRPALIVNHAALLKGTLLYCGVPEARQAEVCERLQLPPASAGAASVAGSVVAELAERLSGLELDGQSVHRLAGLLAEETDAATLLQGGYYRRVFSGANRDAAALIKRGLSAIDQTRLLYEKFGFARPLAIRARPLFVGGVGGYAVYSSGICFQLMAMTPTVQTGANWRLDVLASGGRYDDLLRRFARPAAAAASAPPPGSGAVGVSFAFDRLAQIIRRRPSPPPRPSAGWSSPLDRPAVLVAPLGPLGMRESACRLLHRLWLRNLQALATPASEELLDGTDELRRLFREHRAACVVLAPEPADGATAGSATGGSSAALSASDRLSVSRAFRIRYLKHLPAAGNNWSISEQSVRSLDDVVRHLCDGVAGRPASGGVETHSSLSLKAGSSEPGGGAAAMATGVSAASAASGSTSVTAGILGDDPGATDAAAGGLLADPAGQQISNEDFEASISVTLLLGDRYQHHQRRKAESQARARLAAIAAASAAAAASGGLQLRAVVTELGDSSHRQLVACLRPAGTEDDWQAGWKEALGEHRREATGQRKLLDRLRRWLTDFRAKRRQSVALVFLVGIGDDSGGGSGLCPPLVFLPT
ncbi:hypothetical protein BOX15_Mlig012892g2 [Macrostomum lignano]|uniref:non-specific serine/threonine protein kinase n=1 Tax=Macrostomum lignano TaxID=282301 RepID=A0A267G432_9PLAT|nr:hypothetical protein BOX15_Mlig012892g2 [Macrostomum lignano]